MANIKKVTSSGEKKHLTPLIATTKATAGKKKSSEGPELFPETYTKKLSEDDMAKAKAKAQNERKMANIKKVTSSGEKKHLTPLIATTKATAGKKKSSEGPKHFPETYLDLVSVDTAPASVTNDQIENQGYVEGVENTRSKANIDDYDAILPGAVAVAGIGGGMGTNIWESTNRILSEDGRNSFLNQGIERNNPSIIEDTEETSEHLIKAIVVDDDAIPEAEAVSEESLIHNRRRNRLYRVSGLIIIVIVIVLATSFLSGNAGSSSNKATSVSPTQSASPSIEPSSLPSISPTINFQSKLESLYNGLVDAFDDINSPQYKALQWIEDDSTSGIYSLGFDRNVQRFALVTLYYSLDGDNWVDSKNWLTLKHECDWFSSHQYDYRSYRCLDGNYYSELKLNFNRMRGEAST